MNHKISVTMRRSFVFLAVLCLAIFLGLSVFLSQRVERSVNEISEFYMSAMNGQLQQKFSLIIELTLEKLDGAVNQTPPNAAVYGERMLDDLRTSASARNFTFLGFLKQDGSLETVYGSEMRIVDDENVMAALGQFGRIAEMGQDENGNRCVLLGRMAAYPTSDGTKSAALVAGISTEYLSGVIFADADNTGVISHIINKDGDYVIRTSLPGSISVNYKDYIRNELAGVTPEAASQYISGLEAAIREREEFVTTLLMAGEARRVYCVPLRENYTWYLITVMPGGVLEDSITRLDRERGAIMLAAFFLLLLALAALFLLYYRMSQRQMRELEAAREESVRANRSKSAFLSSMSHDIRTPMNAIVGMSEIALKNLNDTARVEDCLKKVTLSSKQLLGLVNDVLDMSKIESGKMALHSEELSLRETMDTLVSIIQPQVRAKNQHFDIFIRDILSEHVWCDSVRLSQILLNLLSNALKFTPEGGQIHVYLHQVPSPKGEDYVRTCFQVDDTGIGMSPEFLTRIFDSFEREATNRVHHTTGSGLGMSITKRIVDMMGGSIQVTSEQGRGSSFLVTLDLQRAQSEDEMRLPPWNVLIIDDSEPLCESAAANLTEMGVHAEWALNCADGVKLVEERHARGEDYQFVLVDWSMPGMNGLDTIQELRRRVGDAFPIYLISAYDWGDIQDKLASVEVSGFISKPLFKSTLYRCLARYTEEDVPADRAAPAEAVSFAGKRVLLAEDNDLNWEVAQELLGETGLELDRAENGAVCVEMYRQSAPGFYSAVLMDVHMPVMDGYEATKLIRDTDRPDRDIPIIAMTADAFSEDVQQCLRAGMNYHLPKPLDFQTCKSVLARFVK